MESSSQVSVDYASAIITAWHRARDEVIKVGLILIQAKMALPHGEFIKMVDDELPFSVNTAQRLMKISTDTKITNTALVQHLPNSWSVLHELTKLDEPEFLAAIGSGKIHPEMTRNDVIQLQLEDIKKVHREDIPLPDGRFSILYADPPWHYDSQIQFREGGRATNGASSIYKTVKTEDMMKWDIPSLCEDNCLLFLWSSSPHLDQAILLGQAWGFEYSTIGFVWNKEASNPGFYTMSECEICLIFKKGSIPSPRGRRNIRQFLSEKRTTHSTKPKEVMHRITKMFPVQNKLELFSRNSTNCEDGWQHWGDEI
jgi:N6-adenosine-specific RNA methylase IME4